MVFLEPRETERPCVKRGKLGDNYVYLVLDLLGTVRVVTIIDGGLIKIIDGLSSNRRLLNCCVAA